MSLSSSTNFSATLRPSTAISSTTSSSLLSPRSGTFIEPPEVLIARRKYRESQQNLEQNLQTSSLKGSQEKILITMCKDMMTLSQDIERSWKITAERMALDTETNKKELQDLRNKLQLVTTELNDTRNRCLKAENDLRAFQKEANNVITQAETRVQQALDSKQHEVEHWKEQYTSQMKGYLQEKLQEARNNAVREQSVGIEAAMARLEAEYRVRAENNAKILEATKIENNELKRENFELIRKTQELENRCSILNNELSNIRQTLVISESKYNDSQNNSKQLADEVLRLQKIIDFERKSYAELSKLSETKHKGEVEAILAAQSTAQLTANDNHQTELDQLRLAYEAAVRSREEVINTWRAKYSAVCTRAETAESLLREIDRQLVPANSH